MDNTEHVVRIVRHDNYARTTVRPRDGTPVSGIPHAPLLVPTREAAQSVACSGGDGAHEVDLRHDVGRTELEVAQ